MASTEEDRIHRLARHGRRGVLYTWAAIAVCAVVVLIALVAANTRSVRVSWVVGHSQTSLVWLVLVPAVLGWVAGIATSILFRFKTRRQT